MVSQYKTQMAILHDNFISPDSILEIDLRTMSTVYSQFWPKGGLPGRLHHYTESLVAFEYTSQVGPQPHSIIFVGGLTDGLGTSSLTADIVHALQLTRWSFFTLNLSSSYQAWGLGHLDRDTDEIARCIQYVKEYKASKFGDGGKLVLMGHSTGSQCVLYYLYSPNPHTRTSDFDPDLQHEERLPIDGAIMLAPVSDREAVSSVLDEGICGQTPKECRKIYEKLIAMAREGVQDKGWDTVLPMSLTSQLGFGFNTPISCRRFLSLTSPDGPQSPGEDDLFSADLSNDQLAATFGKIHERGLLRCKLMVAPSGADQFVPTWIDKEKNLLRWRNMTDHHGQFQIWDQDHSGVIPGASHAYSDDDQAEPRKILTGKTLGFLHSTENFDRQEDLHLQRC